VAAKGILEQARQWGDFASSELPDWYIGKLKKGVAERWVAGGQYGDFVVRDSSKHNQCVLMVHDNGSAANYKVSCSVAGKFTLAACSYQTDGMEKLINLYAEMPFMGAAGKEFHLLSIPSFENLKAALVQSPSDGCSSRDTGTPHQSGRTRRLNNGSGSRQTLSPRRTTVDEGIAAGSTSRSRQTPSTKGPAITGGGGGGGGAPITMSTSVALPGIGKSSSSLRLPPPE
jgi:hypothetical protein